MLHKSDLDLGQLNPDFLVSNLHKWLFVPRGCAILFVAKRNQKYIRSTLPTSHGFVPMPKPGKQQIFSPLPTSTKSPFVVNFEFVGTIDNAPYLCVPTALAYRRDRLGGEDVVTSYLITLAKKAGQLVSRRLGTEVLDNDEGTLGLCAFSNVRLPLDVDELSRLANRPDRAVFAIEIRDWMSLTLVKEYGTFMALLFYAGAWWVRLSAQVYLDMEDFERAADILVEVCKRVKAGEHLISKTVAKI